MVASHNHSLVLIFFCQNYLDVLVVISDYLMMFSETHTDSNLTVGHFMLSFIRLQSELAS